MKLKNKIGDFILSLLAIAGVIILVVSPLMPFIIVLLFMLGGAAIALGIVLFILRGIS